MHETQNTLPQDFIQGLETFNQGLFYEAHEYFENAWRQTSGKEREFFRAFLHLSGGFFRLTQDRPGAALKFFVHSLKWFSVFPGSFFGYRVTHIRQHLRQLMQAIDQNIPPGVILKIHFYPIHPQEGHKA